MIEETIRGYVVWFTRKRSYISTTGFSSGAPTLDNAKMFECFGDAERTAERYSYPSVDGCKQEPFEVNPVGLRLLGDLAQ